MVSLLFLSSLILGITAQVSTEICYNSQGLYDSSLIACGGSGGCCRFGDICYSNGLCKGSSDATSNVNYYYDGCTSKDWSAPGCAPQCLHKTTLNANGVQPCSGGNNGYNNYCCLGFNATCDCSDESLLVSIPIGTVATLLVSSQSTSSSLTSEASSSSISTPEPATTTSTSTSVPSSTKTPATVVPVPQQIDQQNSSLSTGVIVGIAVGATAFILLCVAGAWFLTKRRRQHQLCSQDENLHDPSNDFQFGEQGAYQIQGYMKPELDSHVHQVSDGSFKDKSVYAPEMSELPSQNKVPVEVAA